MKLLSVEEAQARFTAVCDEALAGETIRLRHASGAILELQPIRAIPQMNPLPGDTLRECYEDPDWAAFENRCAKASD